MGLLRINPILQTWGRTLRGRAPSLSSTEVVNSAVCTVRVLQPRRERADIQLQNRGKGLIPNRDATQGADSRRQHDRVEVWERLPSACRQVRTRCGCTTLVVEVVTTFSSFRFPSSARLVGGVTILDLSGRILAGDGSAALRDLVSKLISEGNKKILLNLGNVNYIDSSGLGELMTAFTSMRSQGGELKLLNLTKRVRDLMQITKLYTVFDITDDEATSIKSFSPSISPPSLVEPNWL